MRQVRRFYIGGAYYFFTVVTHQRRPILCTPTAINHLRSAFQYTKAKHPFTLQAIAVLPDHPHCIWHFPTNDADFSKRW